MGKQLPLREPDFRESGKFAASTGKIELPLEKEKREAFEGMESAQRSPHGRTCRYQRGLALVGRFHERLICTTCYLFTDEALTDRVLISPTIRERAFSSRLFS